MEAGRCALRGEFEMYASKGAFMRRAAGLGVLAIIVSCPAFAQAPAAPSPPTAAPASPSAAPVYATTKVADNVYVFRYGGYQSMFVVTPAGVIATDPNAYQRPQAAQAYIDEIRKITQAPIKYLIYSHHHYDHSAGGKPFKDAGAAVVAHRIARTRLELLKPPDVVIPDMVVDERSTLELGGTRVDLIYVGRNHSDNSLVVLLPKERILFAVDFVPVQAVMFRDIADGYLPDWFASIDRVLALDWATLIPGHPGPGGRMGTKDDVRAVKEYLTDLSNATRELAGEGKCFDEAMRTLKLPKYETWSGYAQYLPGNVERFCEYWARGI
jgi:glyoxylase-like metal-dependent hydrolase (beta-lactamase superfamily II)